jgi:N6-adenosine-specific RNA methylase IME4
LTSYTLNTSPFDLIILDPPWHNMAVSHLQTKKHLAYKTMDNIFTELPPVGNWLAPGGIIAIWCTNNMRKITNVKTVIFERWDVELIAEWIWLKVCSAIPQC